MKRATFGTILCDNYTYLLLNQCYIFILILRIILHIMQLFYLINCYIKIKSNSIKYSQNI